MLLCFDIGNSHTVIGGFASEELAFEFRIKTDAGRTVDEYRALMHSLLRERFAGGINFSRCVVSSVVPEVTGAVVNLVKTAYEIEPLVVGPGIRTGMPLNVYDPSSVGADRVVNALAAREKYGTPVLAVDFGTATSFDYVGPEGTYEGGLIAPGLRGTLESLVRTTSKLPFIETAWPKSLIGKGTVEAMQAGTVVGYVCLVDGLIERVCEEVGPIKHVVATGGYGEVCASHSRRLTGFDAQLTLQGLRIIAERNS